MVDLPSTAASLAAQDWKALRIFIEAFRAVLIDWPSPIAKKLASLQFKKTVGTKTLWHQDTLLQAEAMSSRFYCQTFFDYFGRAPCLPHTFPMA